MNKAWGVFLPFENNFVLQEEKRLDYSGGRHFLEVYVCMYICICILFYVYS